MVKNREGQLKQNNAFNAPSYLSTASYKRNRFSPRRDIWFTGDLHYSPSLVHNKKIKTRCVFDLPFFSITSVASRGRNEMYKIPRTSSAPCQGTINTKWQTLPLWFSVGHLFMSEVLGSNVELMKISLLKVHHQCRLKTVVHHCRQRGCVPAPRTQLVHAHAFLPCAKNCFRSAIMHQIIIES